MTALLVLFLTALALLHVARGPGIWLKIHGETRLARAVVGARRITPEYPFSRNDRRYFGPLCLVIGAGIFLVMLRGY